MKKRTFLAPLLAAVLALSLPVHAEEAKSYIKWVDFSVSERALSDALALDIETHEAERHITMTETLAYLGQKYGGNFGLYKKADLDALRNGTAKVTNEKLYTYYLEAYGAVVGNFVGAYTEVAVSADGTETRTDKYGLRVFSPIAAGYSYTHFDDFGDSRSYGYRRAHLGHDLLGSVGTPIVAVESGYVEALGWNQYGGWRIGIRSFDNQRYYYYAHLRKDHPYTDLYEGKIVHAGEVIGYLGMTGYSAKENVNNLTTPHLHYGLQLIFDKCQKDGTNQIWVDMYALTNFLSKNKSKTEKPAESKDRRCLVYYEYDCTPD